MKFSERVRRGRKKNRLDFGGDPYPDFSWVLDHSPGSFGIRLIVVIRYQKFWGLSSPV